MSRRRTTGKWTPLPNWRCSIKKPLRQHQQISSHGQTRQARRADPDKATPSAKPVWTRKISDSWKKLRRCQLTINRSLAEPKEQETRMTTQKGCANQAREDQKGLEENFKMKTGSEISRSSAATQVLSIVQGTLPRGARVEGHRIRCLRSNVPQVGTVPHNIQNWATSSRHSPKNNSEPFNGQDHRRLHRRQSSRGNQEPISQPS